MTATSTGPNKWALLIGINKYPHLPPDKQLNGCVNDAEVMANILQTKFGFPAAGITRLLDEQATYDGILGAMDALVARVAANDVVVILYSGHGSQMTDREGDELDGLDETIVPHDGGRPGPKPDVTADPIYVRLRGLTGKTPFVSLIFDSCHSATITRDVFAARARWVDPDTRPISELPPSPPEVAALRATQGPASREVGPSGWLPLGDRYVLIAGCRDEEKSYEHPIQPDPAIPSHGALTFFLSQELEKAGPGTTYRDVFERAGLGVSGYASDQHPQMEGRVDRELFGVRDIEPLNFVAVGARDGATVQLGAGAAQGLTVGSRWAIYPQGIKTVAADTPRLGTVEVTAVRAVTADATIHDETPAGAIVVNSRAVEEAHNYGEMRWFVDLQVPAGFEAARGALAEQIAESALLRPAGAGAPPDARVYLIPPRAAAAPADPVPQLGAVTAATWAVVGVDGRLAMPPQPVGFPAAVGTIRENLERLVRYQLALTLRNPSATSPLKDKVTVRLLRRAADGTWSPVPRDAGNGLVLSAGDQVGLEVVNGYTDPIYITVLDFGLARGISALYPIRGAAEAVPRGETLQIGMRDGMKITMSFPANYPFAQTGDPSDRAARGGIETFKVIATTAPADFRPLLQTAVRGDPLVTAKDLGGDSPLNRLLTLALTGQGTREADVTQLGPADDWTTVEVPFFLQPPNPANL